MSYEIVLLFYFLLKDMELSAPGCLQKNILLVTDILQSVSIKKLWHGLHIFQKRDIGIAVPRPSPAFIQRV